MNKYQESWLDPLTEQDIIEFLDKKYSHMYGTEEIKNLEAVNNVEFIVKNGKRTEIKIKYQVRDDFDVDDYEAVLTEFKGLDFDIRSVGSLDDWQQFVSDKNKNRKINKKTYCEDYITFCEKEIDNYEKITREMIDAEAKSKHQALDFMVFELRGEIFDLAKEFETKKEELGEE